MKSVVILNTKLGRRKTEKIKKQIERCLEKIHKKVKIWLWEYPAQIDWLLEQAQKQKFELVIAAGGDGTIHHIGTRLIGTSTILGILPLGSGNGIANHFRIPGSLSKALQLLNHHEIISIDTGTVNGSPFIGFFSIGLDACVIHALSNQKRGFGQYLSTALSIYFHYEPEWVIWEVEGKREKCQVLLLAVLNTSQYGNGAQPAPLASAQDGKFNLISLLPISLGQIPWLMYYIFKGDIAKLKAYNHYVVRSPINIYRIDTPAFQVGKGQVDGEPLFLPTDIKIEILPASLKLLAPFPA